MITYLYPKLKLDVVISPKMLGMMRESLSPLNWRSLALLCLLFFCLDSSLAQSKKSEIGFKPAAIINASDSIIFDLASATLTPTYIDIPLYIKSDDAIFSFDYAMQFNLSKLTFSTTIDLLTNDASIISLAYFNPNDLFLRYTTSSLQGFPTTGIPISVIRFTLIAPCTPVTAADFSSVLTILNGTQCSNRFTNLNFSKFIPIANFSTGPTCSNAPVNFSNLSTIASGTISNNSWAFSNGSTAGQFSVATSFTSSGSASATLMVTANNGCKDTTVQTFTVNIPPTPIFSYTFDCVKDSVLFTNTSTISIGTVSGASWDFGDGSANSNVYNAVHHYDGNGPYTTTLIAISNFSCLAIETKTILLNNKVASNFTLNANAFCIGASISFSDASTYTLGTISSWLWDFGDGNTSNQQNPTHTYTVAGNYSITLTATSTDGCKGKFTKLIVIAAPPNVAFSVSSLSTCANSSLTFTDQSIADSGANYFWQFGNGGTASQQNPVFTYTTPGLFNVKLIIKTPAGCIDSLSKTDYIVVRPSPIINFTMSSTCILSNITFTNTSSIVSGSINTWFWTFGDGGNSTFIQPSHTYTSAGSYIISLQAVADFGCQTTNTLSILATTKPFVDFSSNNFLDCSGDIITLSNRSTSSGSPTYLWNFGDGSSSPAQNPSHTYTTNGYYPIKLVVINPGGCSDSLTKPYIVTLPASVEAQFSYSVTANGVVSFTNQSANSVRSSWDFGDGQTSVINQPQHLFPSINTYTVCMSAINSLNCKTTVCKEIYVGVSRVVAIPAAFSPNSDGHNDDLKVRGGPFIKMELRIYNQWGNLVFLSEQQDEAWDGKHQGEPQAVGPYEYFFTGHTYDDQIFNLYGVVNLIR